MSEAIARGGFFNWMLDVLRAIAGVRTPLLDKTMLGISALGEEIAFILIGLIALWCIDKKFGYRFLFMYMAGTFVNQLLKAIFLIPRPWMIDGSVTYVDAAYSGASGWSFPSGHTQAAVMMYGGLSRRISRGWAYAVAAILVLLVGFSRMYLGVHTLLDVVTAAVLGIIVIALCELLFKKFGTETKSFAIMCGILAALCLGLIIFVCTVSKDAIFSIDYIDEKQLSDIYRSQMHDICVLFGTMFGLFAGALVEMKFVKFETKAVWWVQLIKVLLGIGVILGIRVGMKPLLALISDSPFMDCARYFMMSFVAIAVYPLLFKVLVKLDRKHEK